MIALPLAIFGKTIYFVPYPGANPQQMFYNLYAGHDEYPKKWILLRDALEKAGFTVKFTNDAKDLQDFTCLISVTNANPSLIANLKDYPKNRCWFINVEPPVYLPHLYDRSLTTLFGKIFVMFDDLIDNNHYYKFYYPQPRQKRMKSMTDFSEKKFCVMIAGNKKSQHPGELYSERKKVLSFFSDLMTDELDLYGHGWKEYKNWKGVVGSKWKTIEKYKFCICYENMKDQFGYITEKIFDCFVAGCIPIYWGATNIQDYIPKECFIDRRDFSSYEDLYLFLKSMDRTTYQTYLKAIDRYFESPEAQLYSIDHFIAIIKKHLATLN
jgi:alpha(1,3/1,4) fucosyltransferase